jgi:trans-L-3-hydroxyproline dehydratase
MAVKSAAAQQFEFTHPEGTEDLNFLYGTIFVARATPPVFRRNVCVFANGEVDRSPTGTGVSGYAALLHARGELEVGRWITIESVLGTTFDVRVVEATRVGEHAAVVPEVRGTAFVTGSHEFVLEEEDPLQGFLLR